MYGKEELYTEVQGVYSRIVREFRPLMAIAHAARRDDSTKAISYLLVRAYREGNLTALARALDILEPMIQSKTGGQCDKSR